MPLLKLFLLSFLILSPCIVAIWPQPRVLETGSTALLLSPHFDIQLDIPNTPQDLQDAVSRANSLLWSDKLERLVPGRAAADADAIANAPFLSALTTSVNATVALKSITEEARRAPMTERDEAYDLSIPTNGSLAFLRANSSLGFFRGLTTFEQLWYASGDALYTLQAPMNISDAPSYPYRGFMLDTARNFFPVPDIKRTLDAMSMVKMSTFHWHVVDSQSFPLQIPGFREVSAKGSYSSSSVYTPEDVKDIVDYAGARGIDVLVEIDTPGHTAIIGESHPDFVACPYATPWTNNANEPPAGQLRLASQKVTNFTQGLLSAVADMFPSGLMSTGGDEVNMNCYAQDQDTQDELKASGKTLAEALDVFNRTFMLLRSEMVLNYNATLGADTVVMVWISSENVAAVAEKGFRVVHSASDYFYLDCGAGEWLGANGNANSWCDPFKTWQKATAYSFDPMANLTEAQAKLILGGQQLLWTEQSSPANLDSIVWPRAAASAEVFWTGPGGDVGSALPRLHDVAFRMEKRGIRAIRLQPEWCALRPRACDLTA
ncbi:N-acetylhexosaminidase [Amylostereum chailletii]|nr:N-acetylhexosaminidase [Amylostereum chailletii]